MKTVVLFLLSSLFSVSFSQMDFYHSDFTPCTHMGNGKHTLVDYCKFHNISTDTLYSPSGAKDSKNNRVFFILFTNTPAFGMMLNGGAIEMKRIVLNFRTKDFFNSSEFESELDKAIRNKNWHLTGDWITVHLGMPSGKKEFKGKSYEYNYEKYNIVLRFKDDILSSYRQFQKAKWLN